jgi:hypothetical protein
MERCAGRGRTGCRSFAVDANWQTHQCRISFGSVHTAGQHHDRGAECGTRGSSGASGCIISRCAERAFSGTARGLIGCSGRNRSQKAGCAEACGIAATACTCAGSANATARNARARSLKRLIVLVAIEAVFA